MSNNLPILWEDKVNSPELKAFLSQYGSKYCMTAEEINQFRDAVNEMAVIQQSTFLGAAEPAFTPAGTGRAYWVAVKPGTYANHGGVVVAANEISFIIRDAVGAFSISKTGLDLTTYVKITDLNSKLSTKPDLVIGKNMFNKATVVDNFYMESFGAASASATYYYTDFIEVVAGTQYYINNFARFTTYYNANKEWVTGGSSASLYTFTIPAGVKYIRFTCNMSNKDTTQMEIGSAATAYVPFKVSVQQSQMELSGYPKTTEILPMVGSGGYAKTVDIPSLTSNKADLVIGKNKFNYLSSDNVSGYYINNLNILIANATYTTTGFIPVVVGRAYFCNIFNYSGGAYFCWYDANKAFISASNTLGVVAPANTAFIRYSINTVSLLSTVQIEEGSVGTSYVPYKAAIPSTQLELTEYVKITEIETSLNGKVPFLISGKNLLNKATLVIGSYIDNNNIVNGNAIYDYSDFIPVSQLTQYTANAGMRFVCYYNSLKTLITGGANSEVTTFTTLANVAFIRVTIREANKETFTLVQGATQPPVIPYKRIVSSNNLEIYSSSIIVDVPLGANTFKLFLPKEVCIAVGRTIELYHNQISWCGNINDYAFAWSGIGKSMKRKWTCTGVTIGTNVLTLKVYDKNNILVATATTNVRVVAAIISAPFTLCAIGDSLSNAKPWPPEITTLSSNAITFVGTRRSGTGEGRSGASSSYYLGNNSYTFEATGIAGNDGRTQDLNPFWNPTTSDVDFSYYKSNYNQNPGKLMIWLGTNGIAVDPTTNITNIKSFIDKIRATGGSTIPIFLVHTLFRGNQDGIGKQLGVDGYVVGTTYKLEEDLKVFNLQERMLSVLGAYPNVYLVPVSTCHDSEFNFGSISTLVNPRASQVEFLPVEATHPQTQGYLQIADIIFSSLAANQ